MAWTNALRAHIARHSGELPLCWYSLDQRPRNLFEQVITHLWSVAKPGTACRGAEYWFRVQAANTGFHFHFDRDESVADHVVSPTMSSILYLSDAGGPTLIVDAGPSRTRAPKRGVGIFPRRRRFATFPGELFHGVWPGEASRWPRVAFYVNWWMHRPVACTDPPHRLARECPIVGQTRAFAIRPQRFQPAPFRPSVLLGAADWRTLLARAQVNAGHGPTANKV
jgi:hypothetical protein